MRRLRSFIADTAPAMLAGAFLALGMFRVAADESSRLAALLIGGLYGLAVLGLVRLFRTRSFGCIVAGILSGPVPLALMLSEAPKEADRAGTWVLTALLGLCVGVLEWARPRSPAPVEPPRAA